MHTDYYRGLEVAQTALRNCPPDTTAAMRATAVHTAIAPLLEATPARADRACHRGCSHCCHFPVGITFPEAMRLLDALSSNPDLAATVVREDSATVGSSWGELSGRPCPLLQQGACACYDSRPMPCRALASADADACRSALQGHGVVPVDDVAFARGLGAAAAMTCDQPGGTRELRAALAAMLVASAELRATAFATAREPQPDPAGH